MSTRSHSAGSAKNIYLISRIYDPTSCRLSTSTSLLEANRSSRVMTSEGRPHLSRFGIGSQNNKSELLLDYSSHIDENVQRYAPTIKNASI
jgi:hypothetical protein